MGGAGGVPDNGTAYIQGLRSNSLQFSFSGTGQNPVPGTLFSLISVDLAEYSTGDQTPLTVDFTGYRQNGSTVMTSFTTDGIIDGSGPLADFETFYFGPEFSSLTRVEMPSAGWSMDNLVFRPVPEPEPLVLGLTGGLLLWFLKRRHGRRNSV